MAEERWEGWQAAAAAGHHMFGGPSQGTHWWYPPPQQLQQQHPPVQPFMPTPRTMPNKVQAKNQKPRGKISAYAFFVQICREEHKKKHPDENVVFTEFSKRCSERWRTMAEPERKRFHELADQDKKRYETEMESYTPPDSEKGRRGKKRKQHKDPNAPKRPLTAFFLFINDERQKVKQANPEFTVGEVSKELGRRWASADPSIKSKYEEMADRDKQRYEREMTEYKKTGKFEPSVLPLASKKGESEDDDDDEEENGLQ